MLLLAASPLYEAFSQSDFFGKLIFLGLLVLSIVSWTVIVQKGRLLSRVQKEGGLFQKAFFACQQHPLSLELDGVHRLMTPFFSIYEVLKSQTLAVLGKNQRYGRETQESTAFLSPADIGLVEAHLTSCASSKLHELEKHLFLLSMTVSLAPFLGLLGTVWGILVTFSELQHGAGHANEAILGGLSMALGTTVIGLVVAIPALIGYSYLKTRLRQLAVEMQDFSGAMLAAVEIQYRKVDV